MTKAELEQRIIGHQIDLEVANECVRKAIATITRQEQEIRLYRSRLGLPIEMEPYGSNKNMGER